MAIGNLDEFFAALKNKYTVPFTIASVASTIAMIDASCWRAVSFPQIGAIPAAAAICDNTLAGAFPLESRSGGQERVLANLAVQLVSVGQVFMIEDRLAHMGGLSGALNTVQTVGLNLHTNLAVSNLAARIGNADYSGVEWFLEWYTATGATPATPTVNVVFHDGTTGTANIFGLAGATALPATVAAGRRYKIVPTNGKFIREVTSVQLSVSTGTAGNFGVTARRLLAMHEHVAANTMHVRDWAYLETPEIQDNACVTFSMIAVTTSTGTAQGYLTQAVN